MDPSRPAEAPSPSTETLEFVRFCYRRRRVGWPELYDEMCAVAGRGLFRGWRFAELEDHGIGFSLHQTLELARIAGQVAAEEGDRRGLAVTREAPETPGGVTRADAATITTPEPAPVAIPIVRDDEHSFDVRIVAAAASDPVTVLVADDAASDPSPPQVAVPMKAPGPTRVGSISSGPNLVPSLVRSPVGVG